MVLQTERLILRPWSEDDAEMLYELAKDPKIGPSAGWFAHTSVENSREIIRTVLSAEETYAVVLRETGEPVGSIGLLPADRSNIDIDADEVELGYWIGVPYWGRGLIPEAAKELLRYAFEQLCLSAVWCGYFDGNEKSRRVQEKCGFAYHHTEKDKLFTLTNEVKTEHISRLTREQWKKRQTL